MLTAFPNWYAERCHKGWFILSGSNPMKQMWQVLRKLNGASFFSFISISKPCNAKKLSFIINENYTKIKRLNSIKYKLYKRIDSSNEKFNADLPVEGNALSILGAKRPYSGYILRVYNDLCDTGDLSISMDTKAYPSDNTLPYYNLGNFTFNYLRDKDTNSALYGNFFIVEFKFEHKDEQGYDVIEFESLEYNVSYEEN